jgi:hypothetical protein
MWKMNLSLMFIGRSSSDSSCGVGRMRELDDEKFLELSTVVDQRDRLIVAICLRVEPIK